MRIRFDKIDAFIGNYNGTRYLMLFGTEKILLFTIELDVSLKNSIRDGFSYYYGKTKVDSYDSLLIKKTLILHNLIILI